MNLQKRSFKGVPTILIIIGFLILLMAFTLGLGGFKKLIKSVIASQVKIIEGNDVYKIWADVPIPVYMWVYFFNITNPIEFQQGQKPKLVECGPYIYREHLYKGEINMFPKNDSTIYHQYHEYFYEADLSNGSESDVITMVNIPYVSLAKMADQFADSDFILTALDEMMSEKGETFIRKETVRDILWDGFNVQNYIDLVNDPIVEATGQKVELPEAMLDGRMGLMESKNMSHEGWFTVLTGLHSSDDFGRLVMRNYNSSAMVWKGSSCNAINGTDGMLFPPFIDGKEALQFFIPQMCRSLSFDFTKIVKYGRIETRRYQTSRKMFESPKLVPDNWCFCPHEDVNKCDISGFINLEPCMGGAPLYISNPHLLFVDKEIQDLIEGLNPDPEKHWGYMDLHPLTGASLQTRHRFQFNIKVQQWEPMPTFENVSNAYLPLFWLQQGADLAGKPLDDHKLLSAAISGWGIIKYLLGLFGGLVLPGIAFLIVFRRSTKGESVVIQKADLKMSEIVVQPVTVVTD